MGEVQMNSAVFKLISFWIEKLRKEWNIPGIAISVVQKNQVLFSSGFGERNMKEKLPVNTETLFPIASSTKPFTAMALSILLNEQNMDWDTPIKQYWPSFQMQDPYATDHLTLRDIACHRSGLPRHDMVLHNTTLTREEISESLRFLDPSLPVRYVWQYSNIMYILIGFFIEQQTGMTWEEWVKNKIFEPLEMSSTLFSAESLQHLDNYAMPYTAVGDGIIEIPLTNLDIQGPAGSIISNVTDLSAWLSLLLNHGQTHGNSVISEAQLNEMLFPQIVVGPGEFPEIPYTFYGLGWFVEVYRGRKLISHGGNTTGFSTHISFMPDDDIGIVILANMEVTQLPECIAYHMYDQILGLGPIDWNTRFKVKNEQLRQALASMRNSDYSITDIDDPEPSYPISSYLGEFNHPAYGSAVVCEREGSLFLNYKDAELPLYHYNHNIFKVVDERNDAQFLIEFNVNEDGKCDYLNMPLEPTPGVKDISFHLVKK
ncbi:serine hydrolase [Paenibacillus sp. FSL W8-0186]|uniref:serine hydrolase n=1 Tax=Paenibacillus sp. FSL W8-0186 TaxID=2921709 RepID=UPI0030CFCA9D